MLNNNIERREMEDVREILTTIQDTNKLLEDKHTLPKQYADLHESLNFHIDKVEKLVTENLMLKKGVKLLQESKKPKNTRSNG